MPGRELADLLAGMSRARMDRRSFLATTGLVGVGAALAACSGSVPSGSGTPSAGPSGGSVEEDLWMLNWSEYVAPENMDAFKAEYGVKTFSYDIFSSDDELLAKLVGGASGYDIAAPTALFLPQLVERGYLQKLDFSRIPNFALIDPVFLGQKWDPNNEYHIPKDFGTTGILYRSKVVKEPVTSWREFYDLAVGKYSGRVVVVDSALDVLPMPLKMLGYSLNSVDPKELAEAEKLLLDLAPHILAIDSDTYQDKLASEEAVLALGWTGPLSSLRADPATADIRYVLPSEGTLFWVDAWVLFAEAPHPNAAYAWFDFIERPAIQAAESVFTGYGTPNVEAKKLLPQEMLDDPAIFPPEDVMAKLEGADPAIADNDARVAIWTSFKSSLGG